MKKYLSISFLSFLLIIITCSLYQTGCQSSHQSILKEKPSPTIIPNPHPPSFENNIVTKKQNLSMAKKLKNHSPSEYILGPEDAVEISVLNHNELKMEVSVSPTGKIPYYFIGDIKAAGLSQFQLRDTIQKAISEFIKEPKVIVKITEHRSHKVFVLGQVQNPGVYRIKSEMSLLEAISSAGGITSNAYLGGAYMVRDSKILLVNFPELIKRGKADENIPLLPGDIIYLPDKNDHKVYVLGEVNRQMTIPMEENLSLLGAITQAGGFTRNANKKSVVILRGNLSAPEIITVNIKKIWNRRSMNAKQILERAGLVANIELKRGDILYVPSKFIADIEQMAVRLSNILDPLLKVEREIIYGDEVIDIFKGEDKNRDVNL